MKKFFLALVALGLLATLLVACGGASSSSSDGTYTVHTTAISFAQSSITIPKGSTLTVVDDSSSPHILANGSWMNGSPQGMHEQGMPSMQAISL